MRSLCSSSLSGTRSRTAAVSLGLAAAWSGPALAADDIDLTFIDRPNASWRTMLIDTANQAIYDATFAEWVKAAEDALLEREDPRLLTGVFTFTQCFGGGFLGALRDKGVTAFGANSASRFYQSASYEVEAQRSYYSWAWGIHLGGFLLTDKEITQKSANDLAFGGRAVTANPSAAFEQPQYLHAEGWAPATIGSSPDGNYAILFAGAANEMDRNDLDQIYFELLLRGYAAEDIMVLFDDEELYGGKTATAANLEWAWKTWLVDKVAAQEEKLGTAQVFFWAGDHGNLDSPITISVGPGAFGQIGTDVSATANPERSIYEAGGDNNTVMWLNPFGSDIDAIAFGNDYDHPAGEEPPDLVVQFSVDADSTGAEGSEVERELFALGRVAACDVYVEAAGSNRQMVDGERSLGLEEVLNDDDIDALSLRAISEAITDDGCLTVPVFLSFAGSSTIYVFDPALGILYPYFDFAIGLDFDGDGAAGPAPKELDALALQDDGARVAVPDPDNPNATIMVLYFDPMNDDMLFSIGRNEVALPWSGVEPCSILRLYFDAIAAAPALAVFRTCTELGLLDSTDEAGPDNVDGLDVLEKGVIPPRHFQSPSSWQNYDLNGDGEVDGADLGIVLGVWGSCSGGCVCTGDFDGDGVVGGADLALLLAGWTR